MTQLIKQSPSQLYRHFQTDPLFRNSIFLMLSTIVMSGLGFFFWLLNAHLFPTTQIGIATTLISVMSLISTVSLFGFNTVYIRYLASSHDPSSEVNTGLTLVTIVAALISTAFVLATPIISPDLSFLKSNFLYGSSFVFFMIVSALNMITDSVFIAGRVTQYNLLVNSVMSIVKLLLPPFLFTFGGYGIFMAASFGALVDLLLSLYLIQKRFSYQLKIDINLMVVRRTFRYFLSNYISGILNILPPLILPILILNRLGSTMTAYYYIDLMIANLLYVVPFATSQSLFAEGSYNEEKLISHAKQAALINILLLVPASLILIIAGPLVLNIYGPRYLEGGAVLLQLFTLTGIFVATNYIYAAMFKVAKLKLAMILCSAFGTGVTLLLSFMFVGQGLPGIGVAWLFGNAASAAIAVLLYHSSALFSRSGRLLKSFV